MYLSHGSDRGSPASPPRDSQGLPRACLPRALAHETSVGWLARKTNEGGGRARSKHFHKGRGMSLPRRSFLEQEPEDWGRGAAKPRQKSGKAMRGASLPAATRSAASSTLGCQGGPSSSAQVWLLLRLQGADPSSEQRSPAALFCSDQYPVRAPQPPELGLVCFSLTGPMV